MRRWPAWVQCSHLPCPLGRQGTAAAVNPHACFSKACSSTASCTPHTAASIRQQSTHTHKRAHTYAHTHHMHIYTQTHTLNTHTCTHTHTHTNAPKYKQARTYTYTRTRTNTHAHAYARTRCAHDGLPCFSAASDAPSLVHYLHLNFPPRDCLII